MNIDCDYKELIRYFTNMSENHILFQVSIVSKFITIFTHIGKTYHYSNMDLSFISTEVFLYYFGIFSHTEMTEKQR